MKMLAEYLDHALEFERMAAALRAAALLQVANMCAKCSEIHFKIAHYRQMATRIADRLTLDGIAGLMMELANAKAARHPAEKK